jgi:hypothetical protein
MKGEIQMNMRTRSTLLLIPVFVLLALLPLTGSFAAKPAGFKNLTEDLGRGFGSTWNRYTWSMGVHDGRVYVGTWSNQTDWPEMIRALLSGDLVDIIGGGANPLEGIGFVASDGGEIWRYDGNQQWTRVAKADADTTGFRSMIQYKGKLYAGTANSEEGAELWVKGEDETWEPVPWPEGERKAANNSIRALATFTAPGEAEERLYVGTENNATGGELWAFDGSDWEHVATFPAHSVAEIAVYEDEVYVGTWTFSLSFLTGVPSDTFGLYWSPNPLADPAPPDTPLKNFTKVKPEFMGREALSNVGVMKLVEYAGRLYLGTVNYSEGFTLLSSATPWKPDSWTVLTTNGFGNSDNAYFWSAVVVDNMLLAGTFNSGITGGALPLLPMDGRAHILYTRDGVHFDTLIDDGFGVPFTYGIRCMVVSGDQLLVGTATNTLIPDLRTSLYQDVEIAELLASAAQAPEQVFWQISPYLLEGLLSIYAPESEPFIGTQIWARPVSKLVTAKDR